MAPSRKEIIIASKALNSIFVHLCLAFIIVISIDKRIATKTTNMSTLVNSAHEQVFFSAKETKGL